MNPGRRSPGLRALCIGSFALLSQGCFLKKELPADGPVIEDVELAGVRAADGDRLLEGLATRRSQKFFFWRGVAYDYEVFDEALLERDLQRVERFYRSQGYYEAKVVAARVERTSASGVRVVIVVSEGIPVTIPESTSGALAVQLNGLEKVEDSALIGKLIAASIQPGRAFDEAEYETSKRALRRLLLDHGYAYAQVSGRAQIDLARHEASVSYDVRPGRLSTLGPISIRGLESVPEDKVRASLLIKQGERYSAAELEDARRALINLGVFSSVSVEADTSRPEQPSVPVAFIVGETAPRTLRLGAGARLDSLALAARLTAAWEHRNFLGGMRRFGVETRPGLLLIQSPLDGLGAPERGLFTNHFRIELEQPSFLEGRTRGLLSGEFNVLPLLYTDTEPKEAIIGFLEVKAQTGVERAFLSHQLFASPTLNWQAEFPVDYSNLSIGSKPAQKAESGLANVIVTYPSIDLRLDLRDSPTAPRRGLLLSNNLQVAVPVLGGNVSDVRIQPEIRAYATKARLTLALRATTGLLFPRNYGDTLKGQEGVYLSRDQILDQQKLLFRAFFSGGALSNRGYPFNGVGPHKVLGYLGNPNQRCNLMPGDPVDRRCLRPVGGLTLWEVSLELRFPLAFLEPLGAVLFVDSSDVREGRVDYGLSDPHVSPGFGLRYPTPIGPLRLDLGLRLYELLGKEEAQGTPPRLLGVPITLHFNVGEAF